MNALPTPSKVDSIKPGQIVYVFNENKRRYPKAGTDEERLTSNGPIWRCHWVKCQIKQVTQRSVFVGTEGYNEGGSPISKSRVRGLLTCTGIHGHPHWCLSWEEVLSWEWVVVHRHHIREAVKSCTDPDVLKKIADAVGYVPPTSDLGCG